MLSATRKLAPFVRPYRLAAILAPLLMALEVAMDLLQPRLIQHIIDQGLARGDMQTVLTTGIEMIGVALIGMLGGVGCTIFAMIAALGFGADLRDALFRKVQSLSFGNLDRLETGGLITRLTNDVTQVQELVAMLLRVMVRVPLLLVGSLIMAIITSPTLALIFVVLIPLVLWVITRIITAMFPLFAEVQRRLDTLNMVLQENLAGVRVVKAFARSSHEVQRFGAANDHLMAQNIRAVRTSAITMPFMILTLNAGVAAALWFGGQGIVGGHFQVGQLIAFINYLTQTLMSLMMISMLVVRVARAEASAERVHEVLQQVPDVPNRPDAQTTFAPQGRIVFEDVSFSYYPDGRDPVLKQISFTAEPGRTVAILGATGAGKSSLVNLIPRFYDVTAGRITIDGVDVRDLDESALHTHIGTALQETVLFSGTIRDNIRYSRPDADDSEVLAAAQAAQAHAFISSFPDGYDSLVGQRGVNLSGGQKQRLAIARALLMNPTILILDDSASAVDLATEARLRTALNALPNRPTRIVVAQRISTVMDADLILVLDDGRIAAQGTHAELLERSPIYREIFESQTEHGLVSHD